MKRVRTGFVIGLPALLLVIATSLSGCVKTESVVKTTPSENDVDDLFTPLSGGRPNSPLAGSEKEYAAQIQNVIYRNFYDANSYAGKQCDLRIKLAPDGMLLDVRAVDGDPALCRAAIKAVANTTFPKPPSQAVYGAFKNFTLDFRPLATE